MNISLRRTFMSRHVNVRCPIKSFPLFTQVNRNDNHRIEIESVFVFHFRFILWIQAIKLMISVKINDSLSVNSTNGTHFNGHRPHSIEPQTVDSRRAHLIHHQTIHTTKLIDLRNNFYSRRMLKSIFVVSLFMFISRVSDKIISQPYIRSSRIAVCSSLFPFELERCFHLHTHSLRLSSCFIRLFVYRSFVR